MYFEKNNKNILKIYNRDIQMFDTLCKTGVMLKEHFEEFNITERRIKNYIRDGYINELQLHNKIKFYVLSPRGKDLCLGYVDVKQPLVRPYSYIGLTDYYMKLEQSEKDSWICDRDKISALIEVKFKGFDVSDKIKNEIFKDKKDQEEISNLVKSCMEQNQFPYPDAIYYSKNGTLKAVCVYGLNYFDCLMKITCLSIGAELDIIEPKKGY